MMMGGWIVGVEWDDGGGGVGVSEYVLKHFIALNPEPANHNHYLAPALNQLRHAIMER